jgi:hypothetical protein
MGELAAIDGFKKDEATDFVPGPRFHFHRWSKWIDLIDTTEYSDSAHIYIQQERRCLTCNKSQLRLED